LVICHVRWYLLCRLVSEIKGGMSVAILIDLTIPIIHRTI
jgi:hypothetical protein